MPITTPADQTTTKLQTLKAQIEAAKGQRIQAETRMEELIRQRDTILNEMAALGVTPETIDGEIGRLGEEETRLITEIEELLRGAA